MHRVYLDHTATTPLDSRVAESMQPYFSSTFGNPSSVHSFGREAKQVLENARAALARSIGASPGELFFTSGGTESDNHAIQGVFRAARKSGRNHLVTSAAEHHAVLDACRTLEHEGARITILPVDETGRVRLLELQNSLTDRTCLVSIIHANNEVGTISPIAEISALAHSRGALMHTDAVQTVGKVPVNMQELGVDLLTCTAHKLYGPKGIGALYIRKGVEIENLLEGGGQERGRRPGTENVPLAVGFARALEIALEDSTEEQARLAALRDGLEQELRRLFPGMLVNGHPTDRLPHILSVSFDSSRIRLEGETLVLNMDLEGIAVSSGSACTSGSVQPSHVLLAMGRDPATAKATVRFSFGRMNTPEDLPVASAALEKAVTRARR
jgi:cysteine desulfurase